MTEYSIIGKSMPRVDLLEKVTGAAVYSTDIYLPGMLTGKIKSSPYPFAKILSINTAKARKVVGVIAVITARDVVQHAYGVCINDELPLAEMYARYAGDGVAAVAAIDGDTAKEALDLIEVEYEQLPPVLNTEEAMKPRALAVHPERKEINQNIIHHIDYVRGEGEAAFEEADLVVEEQFSTQAVHQAYLEPQACVCQWDSSDKLTFWGTTQRVFTNRQMLARALGIPEVRIRLIQRYVGGGFGGKEEMHPYWPIAALLARAADKPVKIVYTREEDFISGRPRTSQTIDLLMGFKRNGTMIAKKAVVTVDSGAYAGICPSIMKISISRSDSLYRLPNIHTTANLVYTNTIPRGAFRGFGDPQMLFAMESLIDSAAERLGIDPIELRLKNAVRTGDTTNNGFILKSCGYSDTLRLARKRSDWNKKKQKRDGYHGIGVACQLHSGGNSAITKERRGDGSVTIINIGQDGKVEVISGESELGQGMLTVFAQIVAEELGVRMEDVEVLPYVDTDFAPFCLGTCSSRCTVVGGNAALMAAKDAREKLLKYASEKTGVKAGELEIKNGKFYIKGSPQEVTTVRKVASDAVFTKLAGMPITGIGRYYVPDYVVAPDETCYGNLSLAWTFSTAVAEVAVDTETGKVDVLNIWHALDIGKALNPKICEGQVEGGAVQGIGYALTENYVWKEGLIQNPNFIDYKIPKVQETPKIHSLWVEYPNADSPYGAKGVGEHVLNPIAPAIANAVYNAVGVRIQELPLTPEKILQALSFLNRKVEGSLSGKNKEQ